MSFRSRIGGFFWPDESKSNPSVSPGGDVGYGTGWGPGWTGGWWNAFPSTRIDYAVEAGDPLQSAIVLACIKWICRTFPEAPIRVMQRAETAENADTQPDEVPNHALTKLLSQPNPWYNGLLLWQGTLASLNLDGNAYWLKYGSDVTNAAELWYEPHTTIKPVWDREGKEFISGYRVLRNGKWSDPISRDRVVHFRDGIDPDNPRLGLSPLKAAMREIFTDNEAANFSASLLRNLGVPGIVMSPAVPQSIINDPEGLKDAMVAKFSGDKRGEPLIMQGPTKIEVLSFSPDQMNLEKIRNLPEERITALLGIPAVVVGMGAGLQRSTFHNVGEAKASAYDSNLLPTQRLLAAQLTTDLLPDLGSPDTEYVEFDTSKVQALSEDQNELIKRLTVAYQGGWLKKKEARLASKMNLDVTPEDDIYISDEIRKAARITEVDPAGTLLPPEMLAQLPAEIRAKILDATGVAPVVPPAPSPFGQKSLNPGETTDELLGAAHLKSGFAELMDELYATRNGHH